MHNFDEEVDVRTWGEWIINNLLPCDNVAIVLDDCEEQLWFMLIDETPHSVDVSFKDKWGNTWTEGDVVTRGYWY
jgi:hypothetical protein